MDDKEQKVLEALERAGKPMRPGDIAKSIGFTGDEVTKIMKNLRKKGKVISPKRCFYAPSK